MEKVSKRSGGKLRPGDVLLVGRELCIEVEAVEELSEETLLLSIRLVPGQQEQFVSGEGRLILKGEVKAQVHVRRSKRYLTLGNTKDIDAECRHYLKLRQQLSGSQPNVKPQQREVPSPLRGEEAQSSE